MRTSEAITAHTQGAPAGNRRALSHNYALLSEIVRSDPGRHWTAHEVYVEARGQRPGIGFATVHRGLIRLCELGTLMKIEAPGREAAWYESAAPPHAHLHCVACHGIVDVDYHTSANTLASLAARSGLAIFNEVVTFRGWCPRCAATAGTPAGPGLDAGSPSDGSPSEG